MKFTIPELTEDHFELILCHIANDNQEAAVRYLSKLVIDENREQEDYEKCIFINGFFAGLKLSHKVHMWLLYASKKENDRNE